MSAFLDHLLELGLVVEFFFCVAMVVAYVVWVFNDNASKGSRTPHDWWK